MSEIIFCNPEISSVSLSSLRSNSSSMRATVAHITRGCRVPPPGALAVAEGGARRQGWSNLGGKGDETPEVADHQMGLVTPSASVLATKVDMGFTNEATNLPAESISTNLASAPAVGMM